MTSTATVPPLPAGDVPLRSVDRPWSAVEIACAARQYGRRMAARFAWADRKDRERRRVELEHQARSKREQIRRIGTRLVASLQSLRAVEARATLAECEILAELVRLNRFESLGFVRQSDFAREALKLHPRTLRRRVALHQVLLSVPELETPFLEGRVGVSQVLAVRNVVTPENARIWVKMAERLSVRQLQSLARRAKEKRERDEAEGIAGGTENGVPDEAPAETGVTETAEADDPDANTDPDSDPLEEPHRQCISFLTPQSAGFAIEHGLETAKRALGYEAPRDECLEAILAEAESTLALPALDGTSQDHRTENGVRSTDGTASGAENGVPPDATPATTDQPSGGGRRVTPETCRIWYRKRELKGATRFLTSVDRTLARIRRLADVPQPDDRASEDVRRLMTGALLDRYLALQQQKNPIRILIARALHHLDTLGAGALLGYQSHLDLAAKLLQITPRSARDLLDAGFAFDRFPPLADAYARGQIGFGQVVALSDGVGTETRRWIHRAREVTTRQFHQEVRLLRRVSDCGSLRLGYDEGAFPQPGLEATLRKRLFELGWKQEELDREFEGRGILSPPDASTDPAENPALMARLETLVDMIALERCRRADAARDPGKGRTQLETMLSVPGRHSRVTVWARDPIARHWRDTQARILQLCDHLPDWAVATVLVKAAQDEWDRTDPDRVPTERKILERDGYLCQAPGCSSRKNLEVHHIIFRSLGGSNEDRNLVTLCSMHHRHAVHRHTMRITGEAPHNLTWELGLECTGTVGRPTAPTRARWVYHGERLTHRVGLASHTRPDDPERIEIPVGVSA